MHPRLAVSCIIRFSGQASTTKRHTPLMHRYAYHFENTHGKNTHRVTMSAANWATCSARQIVNQLMHSTNLTNTENLIHCAVSKSQRALLANHPLQTDARRGFPNCVEPVIRPRETSFACFKPPPPQGDSSWSEPKVQVPGFPCAHPSTTPKVTDTTTRVCSLLKDADMELKQTKRKHFVAVVLCRVWS